VYDANCSLKNVYAVFKSDLCTDCPASVILTMVGTRNTGSNNSTNCVNKGNTSSSMSSSEGCANISHTANSQLENTDVSLAAKESRADTVYLECGHSHRCWNCAMEKSRYHGLNTVNNTKNSDRRIINSSSNSSINCTTDNDNTSRSAVTRAHDINSLPTSMLPTSYTCLSY